MAILEFQRPLKPNPINPNIQEHTHRQNPKHIVLKHQIYRTVKTRQQFHMIFSIVDDVGGTCQILVSFSEVFEYS